MLVWCLHNYRPVHVMAERRDDGFWYIPSLRKTIDGAELFRRPQGLIRYVMRLKNKPVIKHHDVPYLKLIHGGKVA